MQLHLYRKLKMMVPQGFANVAVPSPDSPLILSFITSVGIVVIILFCIMAVCVIAALFVILLIYIICECVCWPLFDRFDCDPELGRGINQALIVIYQAVIPNYLQPLDTVDERRALRQQALEKLLPPMVYGSGKLPLRSADCAICLDDYMVGELCRVFPPCKHMFHLNCIDNWLLDNLTCPVCRKCVLDD